MLPSLCLYFFKNHAMSPSHKETWDVNYCELQYPLSGLPNYIDGHCSRLIMHHSKSWAILVWFLCYHFLEFENYFFSWSKVDDVFISILVLSKFIPHIDENKAYKYLERIIRTHDVMCCKAYGALLIGKMICQLNNEMVFFETS